MRGTHDIPTNASNAHAPAGRRLHVPRGTAERGRSVACPIGRRIDRVTSSTGSARVVAIHIGRVIVDMEGSGQPVHDVPMPASPALRRGAVGASHGSPGSTELNITSGEDIRMNTAMAELRDTRPAVGCVQALPDRPGPDQPLAGLACINDMAAEAEARLPKAAFDYYAGGSGTEWTLAENERAFRRWVFRRRVLVDVSEVDTAVTVLGRRLAFPVLLAPVALQRMAHRDGELATARAAAAAGTTMILSTLSSTTIEDVADTGVDRWFQLYVHKDRGLTAELIDRAVAGGYRALVLTVDTPQLGRRDRDERNRFLPPPGVDLAILTSTTGGLAQQSGADGGSSLFAYFARQCDASVTWTDVEWVRSRARLPVVLKGIMTAEDARRAADEGVDAISVSNHGGRQLDGDPATIDALPEVADEVGDRLDVLVDGGVRRGTDVLCALALGARAVLIGRPQLWGLACGGEAGVRHVLDLLRMDFTLAMRLAGVTSADAVDRSLVRRAAL